MYIQSTTTTSASQLVNQIAKYFYMNLAGAVDFKKSSNLAEVWTIVLYQVPIDIIRKYNLPESYKDVSEMLISISLTPYITPQGMKLRVNLIEESPDELTLGHKTFDIEKLQVNRNKEYFDEILNKVEFYLKQRLEKRYQDYDFLY